jgi:hypothetical protein
MPSIPTQEEFLDATRKSQEAMIAAIRTWFETVRTATPKLTSVYAPLTGKLPRLPSVSLPFADKLPTPEEAVANAYDTAEQLLASQRKFTEELLKAMTPLIPGQGSVKSEPEIPSRSAWRDAVATTEPAVAPASTALVSTPPASAAAEAAPVRPAVQETPSLPKLRTSAAKPATGGATSKSTPAASTRKSTTGSSAQKSTPAKTAAKPTPAKASPAPEGPEAS